MIQLPTTETESRWRRHIHKQMRLLLTQTVLSRIMPLIVLALSDPPIHTIQIPAQRTVNYSGIKRLPKISVCGSVSIVRLSLMPPSLTLIKTEKLMEAPYDRHTHSRKPRRSLR